MEINTSAKYTFISAAKWAKFISIYGFICCGICALFALLLIIAGFSMPPFDVFSGISTFLMGVFYLIVAVIPLFPSIFLMRFAKKIKKALEIEDSEMFAKGVDGLDSYFKFTGVLYIISIVFIFMIMLFGIVAGVAAMSAM